MLTTHSWRASAALLLALWLAACGGGGPDDLNIPLFEFGFSGSNSGVNIQVFFLPDTPTQSSGNFDSVNMNVDARPQLRYTGGYSGCNFNIELDATSPAATAPVAASYSGRFTGNDSIELRPTSGVGLPVLTLQRQGVGTRNTGC